MATNKPSTPSVPYFNGWMAFATVVCLACTIPAYFNLAPFSKRSDALDQSNWWWYIGLVVLLFGTRLVQVMLIRKRVAPKWEYPNVRPWSDPLIGIDGKPLSVIDWFACSAGYTYEKALLIYTDDSGRQHQVNTQYNEYRSDFEAAYGS